MLKRIFYASASVLMLALAYHLGASTVNAQPGSTVTGVTDTGYGVLVMTANGDLYLRTFESPSTLTPGMVSLGNYWATGATSAQPSTWGGLKARFR